MAINKGQVNFGTPGTTFVDAPDTSTRRLYDFSDRVADLAPTESPFFVYLSKVGKVPTTDPQFRFLEDRTKIAITDRSFYMQTDAAATDAGAEENWTVATTSGGSTGVKWLVKGMVIMVDSEQSGGEKSHCNARVESVSTDGRTIGIKWLTEPAATDINGSSTNVQCQVIGTSFAEGSGAPDVWSQELDNDYGYTQIFKTACEMSNTARATVYRGYADEWQRIWNLKLREHKVDIERAMLFGQRTTQANINYTEGIVGHIIANAQGAYVHDTGESDDGVMSYNEGYPYHKTWATGEFTYDRLLGDFEVLYDPARGGSDNKLALASLPVITYFNKMGSFVDNSIANEVRYNIDKSTGSFGHSIMKVDTVHGSMSLVKEPLFRGISKQFLCLVDLDHVAYRPLVGNGVNRDTSITTNVQQADEDLRKDMILTEAGLEVSLPETHALFNLEGV
tara:strand:- start:2870 stop:4219 length:1350 start_codon:yes stop_codon:yes gene_type:complete